MAFAFSVRCHDWWGSRPWPPEFGGPRGPPTWSIFLGKRNPDCQLDQRASRNARPAQVDSVKIGLRKGGATVREVWRMWNYATMVVLTVLTAGLFAAILIPFKGIPLIPGLTELRRPTSSRWSAACSSAPPGPGGAAFGNLIGDFFGTLGIGSFFGFWAIFWPPTYLTRFGKTAGWISFPGIGPGLRPRSCWAPCPAPWSSLRSGGLQAVALRHHRRGGLYQQRAHCFNSGALAPEVAGAPGATLGPLLAGADGPGGIVRPESPRDWGWPWPGWAPPAASEPAWPWAWDW